MKKRNFSLIAALLVFAMIAAQEKVDTTIVFNQKTILLSDSADQLAVRVLKNGVDEMQTIYEGIFVDDTSVEVYTAETRFDFSFPFKKKKKNKVYGSFEGLYIGRLFSTDYLTDFDDVGGFVVAGRSNEISVNPLQYTVTLVPGYLGLTSGVGATWRNLHPANNMHFVENSGGVTVEPAPDGIKYRYSRLRTFDFNVPFYVDIFPAGKGGFYLSGGVLLGANVYTSAKVKYRDDNNKKVKLVEGKNYNVNPFSLSYVGMVGFESFGIYAKYTPTPFFKNGKGPDFQTFAVGVVLPFD